MEPRRREAEPQGTVDSLDVVLSREELAGEHKIARTALVVCGVAVVFCLLVALFAHQALGLWLAILTAGYSLHYTAIIWLIRRGRYRRWMRYLSTTLEVGAATLVGVIDAIQLSPAYSLTSSPQYLYYLAIGATTLRFQRSLSLYAGVAGAVQLSMLYLVLQSRIPAELLNSLPSLRPPIYLQRAGYLLLAGVLSAAICGTLRRLIVAVVDEVKRRQALRRIFGRYLSDEALEQILRQGLETGGELRQVTILCSDLRDFTSFSASRQPQCVVRFLNALFERQCEIVDRHGGRVDKFLGDGMLAVFGPPLTRDHARSAARAAIEIAALSGSRLPDGPEPLELGVALHSGLVLVGSIGSPERLEYTAIGSTVNMAFRIEGLNRRFGTRILLTEETRAAIGEGAELVSFPPSKVRGVTGEIQVYELRSLGSTDSAK